MVAKGGNNMTKVGYSVEPKSRKDLRNLAFLIRKTAGLGDIIYFPVVEFLELMPLIFEGFNWEIVEDDFFPSNVHGDTLVNQGLVRIKESVYVGACNGDGQHRMTIMHEIAHWITLCFLEFSLQRSFSTDEIPTYCDPEWQAKCLAGEIMMPAHLVADYLPKRLVAECGVSKSAARYQRKIFREEETRKTEYK